jgi:hypothetical protein
MQPHTYMLRPFRVFERKRRAHTVRESCTWLANAARPHLVRALGVATLCMPAFIVMQLVNRRYHLEVTKNIAIQFFKVNRLWFFWTFWKTHPSPEPPSTWKRVSPNLEVTHIHFDAILAFNPWWRCFRFNYRIKAAPLQSHHTYMLRPFQVFERKRRARRTHLARQTPVHARLHVPCHAHGSPTAPRTRKLLNGRPHKLLKLLNGRYHLEVTKNLAIQFFKVNWLWFLWTFWKTYPSPKPPSQ